MKKFALLLLVVGIGASGYILTTSFWGDAKENVAIKSEDVALAGETGVAKANVEYGGIQYAAAWFEVADIDKVSLFANFDAKENASRALADKNCKALVNGGFYTEDGRPTGLFVADGVTTREFLKNALYNGILSVNQFGIPRITGEMPSAQSRWAVQSGPVLEQNGQFLKLSLLRDKPARRVVAAVTGGNKLIFMVIYNSGSTYGGPYLADLPEILRKLDELENPPAGGGFADAINLDGGSASAFIFEDFQLVELSPIGSYFCVKP